MSQQLIHIPQLLTETELIAIDALIANAKAIAKPIYPTYKAGG